MCFSFRRAGHSATCYFILDDTFPFMLPGWKAENTPGDYVMISPRAAAERRRAENGPGGGGGGFAAQISGKVRPQDPGGGAARIAVPWEAVDMETRNASMSSVVGPQSVPSRISVVMVEETEVQEAERLASVPMDKPVRLLARAACPAGVTVCKDGIVMSGAVGTLSPSDSHSVGPVGPVGTLSPSDSVGPVGTLSPSDSPSVGPVGMPSLSDSVFVGHYGPDGTLSSSDFARMLFPAVPAGIPFPVGPVGPDGMLSSSDLAGKLFPAVPAGIPFPAGPVGTLSLFDHVEGLSPIVPVGEPLSVDHARMPPGGLVPAVWTEFSDRRDPVITQLPVEVPVRDKRYVGDMDITVDICRVVPEVIDSRAVVAMVGLDTVRMGEETLMDCDGECAEWHIRNEFETVDGMPLYSGGDLHDSDELDWEDPYNIAYTEYVERYNLDALEGFELKVFERSDGCAGGCAGDDGG